MDNEILYKARRELQTQFMSLAVSVAKGFQHGQTATDVDQIVKLAAGISALDAALKNGWASEVLELKAPSKSADLTTEISGWSDDGNYE